MMTHEVNAVEQNRHIQLNWGTFNVPSLASIVAIGALIWNASSKIERQDARIDTIETQRAAKGIEVSNTIRTLQDSVSGVPNLMYRITVAEQGIADLNRRVDRIGETMNENFRVIRDGMGDLSTKFEVMNETLNQRLPDKRAELLIQPPELRSKP